MALSTYVELQAAITSWLQRDDMATVIPDMIALCEKNVSRRLRVAELEETFTTSPLTETTALPPDFWEMRTLTISYSGTLYAPRFVLPQTLDAMKMVTPTLTGVPEVYTIRDQNIEVFPAPDSSATYTMFGTYYEKLVPLVTTSPNWLLTNHPDIYLFGSLAASEMFNRNDPRVPMWKQAFEEALSQLVRSDDRKRFVKGVSVDLGLPGSSSRAGIETGFF